MPCPNCGSDNTWDDNMAWGCNKCDWSSLAGLNPTRTPSAPYSMEPDPTEIAKRASDWAKKDATMNNQLLFIPKGMVALTDDEINDMDAPWSNCIDDCINDLENVDDYGPSCIVKCTLKDLHVAQYRSFCSSDDSSETCFKFASEKYPNTQVITCIHENDKTTSSCSILITSFEQGEDIMNLIQQGGGSLRFDNAGTTKIKPEGEWFYFENE